MYLRGGIPTLITGSVTASDVSKFEIPGGVANHFLLQNLDAAIDLKLYFSQADADADRGILVPAPLGSPGNPLELPAEISTFWLKSASTGTVQFAAVALLRRG